MTAYCHTNLTKLRVFRAKNCDARLIFFEKLTLQMNLVVEWCLGGGGCGKNKIFQLSKRFSFNENSS